jgi:hypothetical protein
MFRKQEVMIVNRSHCEHTNEPSGSIKDEEFLDQIILLLDSQETLRCMALIMMQVFLKSEALT